MHFRPLNALQRVECVGRLILQSTSAELGQLPGESPGHGSLAMD